jgi:hypothetical protein
MTGFGVHHLQPETDPQLLRSELDDCKADIARMRKALQLIAGMDGRQRVGGASVIAAEALGWEA